MILSGELNLITCPTEKLVEVGEALVIAMEQRKAKLRKMYRKHGKDALTDFELRLIDANDPTLELHISDGAFYAAHGNQELKDTVEAEFKLLDIPAER